MFRFILLYLSKLSWAQRVISRWKFAWRMASRFIAGEDKLDALKVITVLNSKGINATVDYLGENVTNLDDARLAAEEVMAMFELLHQAKLHSNVSVKLSQMGLGLDEAVCKENIKNILNVARRTNNFLRIDMEDSSLVDRTLGIYRWARQQGYENVGVVIQSYLYRSYKDIESLAEFGVKVRLCKGAYKEPHDIAFPQKKQVDQNFDRLTDLLFEVVLNNHFPLISENGRFPPVPALATHDIKRIQYAQEQARVLNIPKEAFEFQLLYGIRRDIQESLVSQGYQVRVYVPYGTRWYPYFMRRLAERPANVWFFVSNFFQK